MNERRVPICPKCQNHKIYLAPSPPLHDANLYQIPVYCSECTWLGQYNQLTWVKL